jgi:hypothetical protein
MKRVFGEINIFKNILDMHTFLRTKPFVHVWGRTSRSYVFKNRKSFHLVRVFSRQWRLINFRMHRSDDCRSWNLLMIKMSLLYLEDFKIDNEMFKSYLAHTWEWFIKVALWLNFSVRFQINFFFSFTLKTSLLWQRHVYHPCWSGSRKIDINIKVIWNEFLVK